MTHFDVFNGDADGICALLQLRQADPRPSQLVTGVKRDISLLQRVAASPGDTVTVLDIAVEKNRIPLEALLAAGISVFYVDHHNPGELPIADTLQALINTAPEVCTSALVNGHLQGAVAPWAVVGCYGDNLDATAERIAATLSFEASLPRWRELGILINYNAYGAVLEDLHFDPEVLYQRLLPYTNPDDCLNEDPELIAVLRDGYEHDMALARSASRLVEESGLAIIVLPDESWARRVSGVLGNQLAVAMPNRAHAVLTDLPEGYLVSVRAPLANRTGADTVCRQFATGGGRAAAAGINLLPADSLDRFIDVMRQQFG